MEAAHWFWKLLFSACHLLSQAWTGYVRGPNENPICFYEGGSDKCTRRSEGLSLSQGDVHCSFWSFGLPVSRELVTGR